MNFRFKTHQIHDVVKADKVVREGQSLDFKPCGSRGKRLRLNVDLKKGSLWDLQLSVEAGRVDEPATYRAALLLEGQRIRGIDFSPTPLKRFYKKALPAGWHENLIDPNLATQDPDQNRHVALPNLQVTDLQDFLRKACKQWKIEISLPEVLL